MNFKKVIEEMQKDNGVCGKDLAKKLSISPPSVSATKSCENPQLMTIEAYAKALNPSAEIIIRTGKGKKTKEYKL